MYHEVTTEERKRKRRRRVGALAAVVLTVVLLVAIGRLVTMNSREQGAAALREAIMNAAVRCCAVEGSYPLSLDRLEESYGLRVNRKDYVITYEAFASNIAPSVVVVPR